VADDEALIRKKERMMLGESFRLGEAATAESARREAAEGYDAILLDIVFPDGNGIEICKEIKERDPYSTVVISSSMESVDSWNRAFEAGADGYLEKRELIALSPAKIALMIRNLVERNRLRRQAEETNQRQAELLSVLSHDVRAPFQALMGTVELLRKSRIPDDAARKVETLYGCATDQLAFINSLLELLRLESGATEPRVSPVDINLPVNQSLQALGVLAEAKDISISTGLQHDLPIVRADMARISQLMNNLVGNAIKFTPRGGRVCVETTAITRKGTPGVEIRVQDNGIGISPEDREKIFVRFRRGNSRGTEGETGTGLGLSICKRIVKLHGGTLRVDSVTPSGTVFSAWLPCRSKASDKDSAAPIKGLSHVPDHHRKDRGAARATTRAC